ncbi:hypothetical protein C808_00416 [Lachnospiraceae bacterium M18-1]|nr:hypothetical protein C808_00416 [Lachnospiraceae bacterium M18-1]
MWTCLCSENVKCNGCYSDNCPDYAQYENRICSNEKGFSGCYACEMDCKKGLLNKIKPYGFTLFIKYSRLPASYDKAIRRGKYE